MAEKLLTLQECLYKKEAEWGDQVYLRQSLDWEWHEYTWREVMTQARKVASFLKSIGLKKGDRVSILSRNCAEWFITDFGIMLAGMVNVPLYATLSKENIRHILTHAEVKLIFLGRLEHDRAKDIDSAIPSEIPRCDMGYYLNIKVDHRWSDILQSYEPLTDNFVPELSDLATIIYSSGTTGTPKGVIVTYEMIANYGVLYNAEAKKGLFYAGPDSRWISYLPLAHIFERAFLEIASIVKDSPVSISFVDTVETFVENLRDVRPTVFIAVPRIWTILQAGVLRRIDQKKINFILKIPIFGSLFKRRVRRALGLDKTKNYLTGSAPIASSVIEWWRRFGIHIQQGYGMTENMAITSGEGPFDQDKLGSVGPAVFDSVMKISEEGELLVKNRVTTPGYYKDPETTAKLFTDDGFLKTGDKVRIDEDGFIFIIGRVKDTFKTDKGEFVDPVPIESMFQTNPYVEQVSLLGLNLVQPVMVVVLNQDAKEESREVVEKSLKNTLNEINPTLTTWQKISHVFITRDEWTTDTDFVTATLKIRRNKIAEAYTDRIKKLATKTNPIIWE